MLWKATGIVIDDTDFGSGTDTRRSRFWFPPCSWPMGPPWWARMRKAAERVEEALRTGTNLRSRNFAEQVVLAAVVDRTHLKRSSTTWPTRGPRSTPPWSDPVTKIRPDFEASLESLEFRSVLTDMLDDTQLPRFLYPDDLHETSADLAQPTAADLEQWFDPRT